MAEDCEKEKHISVLVEQAFPTCIMVSYKDEGKTYRGVLLDESSHIVTRASLSRTIEDKDSSNLCLTSSRAVTCSSSDLPKCESRTPQDKHDDDIDHSSSEHQGRSLIKSSCLRKRQIRTTQTGQPVTNSENMTNTRRLKSPEQKISLMKSLKRKRSKPSTRSGTSSFENGQEDLEQSATNDNSQHFPVLKLKRTTGTSNNYVALISEKSQKVNAETGKESPYVQSNKSFDHRHNTRYRGRKRTDEKSNHQEINVKSEEPNEKEILSNGDEIVEVYTKEPGALINENGSQRGKHVNINQCYAKRGVQPRNHNVEMRVGEIIWGKVHGHPWWPGRILHIICHATEDKPSFVKVSWYGSTTTSEISCSFLMTFEEHFKQLYKKQKQGAYRRAVRQAQQDLQVMYTGNQG